MSSPSPNSQQMPAWEFVKAWQAMAPEERACAAVTWGKNATEICEHIATQLETHAAQQAALIRLFGRNHAGLFENLATVAAFEDDRPTPALTEPAGSAE